MRSAYPQRGLKDGYAPTRASSSEALVTCRLMARRLRLWPLLQSERYPPVVTRCPSSVPFPGSSYYCPCLTPGSPTPLLTSGASWAFSVMPTGRTGLPATPSNIRALAVYQAQIAETMNV